MHHSRLIGTTFEVPNRHSTDAFDVAAETVLLRPVIESAAPFLLGWRVYTTVST
ncbi:hypothetical protein [Rubripirellula reticaptiva]|uniref:hypothetical protein n=1 Tax=Rubripirellula reticaptiva TaxID=2528013 RepID=UPI00164439E0|nr:hypothetical protein [Rubripirellula reticaptiva]